MKRLRYLVAAVAALLAIAGFATAANAATVEECQAKIDALAAQTASADFLGRNADRDRAGLLGQLDGATTKLAEGKFGDTIQKVTEFRTTVEGLNAAAKTKIDPDDAATLIAGANDTIACVSSLLETATAS